MKSSETKGQRILLWCGILSSIWYVIINVLVPLQYDGYSIASLTVSELSAIGAPTRSLWVPLAIPYVLLFAAFGFGLRQYAKNDRRTGLMGGIIIVYAFFNIYWPPMHMRGTAPTLTDTLHIVWASVTVLMIITIMIIGAVVFNGFFRAYTIVSIAAHVLFGALTSLQAPQIPLNGSTPTIGLLERINIGVFTIWVVVLAARCMQTQTSRRPF